MLGRLPTDELPLVLAAVHFAAEKHRHQRRKDVDASPYINHPIAVAEILCRIGNVRDPVTLIAGILHDTIEDTETTSGEIGEEFGAEVCAVVEEVTDDTSLPGRTRKQLQIEHAPNNSARARLVKLADKISNVRDIVGAPPQGWSAQRRRDYVRWAQAVIDAQRGTNVALEEYFDSLCAGALAQIDGESKIAGS
jgi:GTP diphosphokinase / guanosine-3',5'-bis(diphosphate) 3'-diphosphatase